ncbi:MAG: HAMP domain-containing sensor histidine kinase [Labilithrix sp.]
MRSRIALPGIFGLVVLCFVAATAFVHWEMSAIDDAANEIADDAAPGIEDLAEARGDLRRPVDPRRVDHAIEGYLSRPVLPGERRSWNDVHRAKEKLDAALRRYDREARAEEPEAETTMQVDVPAATEELGDAITGALESNAARTRESALRIRQLRSQASHVALGLDLVCTLIALSGALLVHRVLRLDREQREARAKELEDFASRVAHDILSPLGAITFAFDLVRRTDDETQRTRIVDRGSAALGRIQRLTEGLLDFARAGGRPADGARADVGRTIADLVAELEPAAYEKSVQLTTKQDAPLVAACNPGVLTSLVANLARNALKYLGDARERRIEIRALEHGARVRVEVEDTGPGLPPELAPRVFDPYVRAGNTNQPGFGLGLATVKRLAEAHGGTVGVRSELGSGSTFWFELPLTT